EFSEEESFVATIVYLCIFFIPLRQYFVALPYYALAPMYAHLTAAFNVATISLIRAGYSRNWVPLAILFAAALFVAFASAPLTWITYFPIYGLLWGLLVLPWLAERKLISGRLRVLGFGLLLLAATGAPLYVGATVATSARGAEAPALLHPGWELLRP